MPVGDDVLRAPKWMSPAVAREYRTLCRELRAVGVPLRTVDRHAIAMAAQTIATMASGTLDDAMFSRFSKDLQAWLEAIGATPRARVRMGTPMVQRRPEPSAADKALAAITGETLDW